MSLEMIIYPVQLVDDYVHIFFIDGAGFLLGTAEEVHSLFIMFPLKIVPLAADPMFRHIYIGMVEVCREKSSLEN